MEERKRVPSYPRYLVSSLGRIKLLLYIDARGKVRKEKIIKTRDRWWYMLCFLDDNWKDKSGTVHRLVAEAFIPNPDNKRTVNHKDWNKHNNCVDNLERATDSENCKHRFRVLWHKIQYWGNIWKWIIKYDLDMNRLDDYPSLRQAHIQNNCLAKNIRDCCRLKQKQAYGYVWRYK